MRKTKRAALAAIIALCCNYAAFAQCFNTEEQYAQKVRDMQEQCGKIIAMVPCAIGFSDDYPFQDGVLRAADDAALVQLAISVEAFVKYHSADSMYIDRDVEERLRENVSKVKVKLRLNNTFAFPGECAPFAKNGKTLYRGASLRVLNRELYNEALADVNKIEKEEAASSSSSVSASDMQASVMKQSAEPPKISIPKQIARAAKKYAPLAGKFILGILGL